MQVFVSHGWEDRWIARQIGRCIESVGATAFIDIFDLKKGDRIEATIQAEIPKCDELLVLLTPGSVRRNWVWTEVGAAWGLQKRIVGVIYGLTFDDIERNHGGMAALGPRNCLPLNDLNDYIGELAVRVKGGS